MDLESEITLLPTGEVNVDTIGKSTYQFSSVDRLRRYLSKEQFHTLAKPKVGNLMLYGGAALVLGRTFGLNLPFLSPEVQVIGGLSLVFSGENLIMYTKRHKPELDSIISAFNKNIPHLKPISTKLRDYLPAIRIPFIHR